MTNYEKYLMLLITGFTNFSCLPCLYIVYQKGLYLQFHFGLFTAFTSFMYHSLESVRWRDLYLDKGTWHKLDNIGSVTCFIIIIVYFMDNLEFKKGEFYSKHVVSIDVHLIMIGLFITMIMQAKHAWLIENTVIPILIFFAVFLVKIIFIRRSRFNYYYFKRGAFFLFIAICFFIKGLDERKDYLRFYHGMWHCFLGISSFYLWQCIDKDKNDGNIVIKVASQKRYSFWFVMKQIFSFRFFKIDNIETLKIA